jgi:hypothetical protein
MERIVAVSRAILRLSQGQVQAQRVIERGHQLIGQPTKLLADALSVERSDC